MLKYVFLHAPGTSWATGLTEASFLMHFSRGIVYPSCVKYAFLRGIIHSTMTNSAFLRGIVYFWRVEYAFLRGIVDF